MLYGSRCSIFNLVTALQSSDPSSETSARALDLMVDRLVADLRPVESPPVARRLALGLGVGLVISLTLVGIVLGYRPDMASATMTMIFWVKLAYVSGIGAVALTGWLWLDALVAIGVALNILREGGHLIWRSSQGLMDEAVEPDVLAEIENTLAGFAHRRGEISIIRFDHITTRRSGQRRFVDLHMHMPASWTLGRAAPCAAASSRR